ncbi:MAG: hypothetical protein ACI9WU_003115 [Myxococcota bacterium]|jgi:hypothetical protein
MFTSRCSAPLAAMLVLLMTLPLCGCPEKAEFWDGEPLDDVRLVLFTTDLGVHPSTAVLSDPNNPFRLGVPNEETKWQLLDFANNSAAFYGWATILAILPHGEAQYYAASRLHAIYNAEELSPAEQPFVRDMAIAGYQALLDYFPNAVSFDPTGTWSFDLATPAYQGIVDLGGSPTGGWVLLATPDGQPVAVKTLVPEPVEE